MSCLALAYARGAISLFHVRCCCTQQQDQHSVHRVAWSICRRLWLDGGRSECVLPFRGGRAAPPLTIAPSLAAKYPGKALEIVVGGDAAPKVVVLRRLLCENFSAPVEPSHRCGDATLKEASRMKILPDKNGSGKNYFWNKKEKVI